MRRLLRFAVALALSQQVAALPPREESEHVVAAGETLNGIANRAGVTRSAIIAANGLKPPYPLRTGQKLAIPRGKAAQAGKAARRSLPARQPAAGSSLAEASSYVVQPGDSLGSIALRARIPRILIAEANGIVAPFPVKAGQKLELPRTRRHTVVAGDTGFSIAYRYAVPWEQIAIANGIDAGAPLAPGKVLLIPALIASSSDPAEAARAPDAAAPKTAASRFAWPLAGPIRRDYRARGAGDYHDGIDISAPAGVAARAVAAGKVIFARKDPDQFGNLVVIDHGDGWHSAYGSLETITVRQGDAVAKGERVGMVGATSLTRQTELHFELRKAGKPVDPVEHLPARP